jgi:acetate kinase
MTALLVVNAGSSSLKLRVLADSDEVLSTADLPAPRGATDTKEIEKALASFGDAMAGVRAAGHRIVHGGDLFSGPVLIDADVRKQLGDLTDLAPLHQPKSLAALDAVNAVLPGVPAVGCFDTAFHVTIPPAAATFALPAQWRERWGLRRFGFHGLSHAYIARRTAELLDVASGAGAGLRLVSCHLGAGASLAAVCDGRSVDTTMSFTPLDGLIMATRSGSLDPGLVLWLQTHAKIPVDELSDALEHKSGLYGLAGTGDMLTLLSRATATETANVASGTGTAGTGGTAGVAASSGAAAVLARDAYLHRLRGSIAAMAAALGGLDALVFTGGVGENSAEIRSRTMDGLGFLGVHADAESNATGSGDREIGTPASPVRTLLIAAREDLEITRQVREVLPAPASAT